MTKEDLIRRLGECDDGEDTEQCHDNADDLLLQYINDPEVTEAYKQLPRYSA
jgi:hypothetical protein